MAGSTDESSNPPQRKSTRKRKQSEKFVVHENGDKHELMSVRAAKNKAKKSNKEKQKKWKMAKKSKDKN